MVQAEGVFKVTIGANKNRGGWGKQGATVGGPPFCSLYKNDQVVTSSQVFVFTCILEPILKSQLYVIRVWH